MRDLSLEFNVRWYLSTVLEHALYWSGSSLDVEFSQDRLENTRYKCWAIIAVDRSWDPVSRDVIFGKVLYHSLSSLVFDRPGFEPFSVTVDCSKNGDMTISRSMKRTHEVYTELFAWAPYEIMCIRMALRRILCMLLTTMA